MRTLKQRAFALVRSVTMFVLLLGFSGYANAVSIPITNWDFETSTSFTKSENGNQWNQVAPPGWVSDTGAYVGDLRPGPSAYDSLPTPPSPNFNVAWSNHGTLFQQLTGTRYQSGHNYALMVDIGHRKDTAFGGGSIALYADDLSTLVKSLAITDPGINTFTNQTLVLSDGEFDSFIGQTIVVGLTANRSQVNFDNVKLSSLPIPASFWLFGSGAFALVALSGRRRKTGEPA